jgi:uncharacterized protein YecT (DUF1311 family)
MARHDRDPVAEILSIQQRGASPSVYDLERLQGDWRRIKESGPETISDFFPIRIVTILEVFTRSWIARLIDHGPPFADRAADLRVDIKFDFDLVRSLQGRDITLGQLIGHSVSVQRIEALAGVFSKILDSDLFDAISRTPDRFELEEHGDAAKPIIKDMPSLRKSLAQLFELRHVLVHEFPRTPPHTRDDVEQFFSSATDFVRATEEMLLTTLYGRYPITQHDMNRDASERAEAALKELSEVTEEVVQKSGSNTIYAVQQKWEAFKNAEADWRSESYEGGSMRPMVYYSAAEHVAKERIRELRTWLKEEEPK